MAEVYAAINTLQERVLVAQENVKRGLSNIALWGDKPLHNRRENLDRMELLAVAERHPRFLKRNNVKQGLSNIVLWGDKPLHNRKENLDKMELLAVAERHPRFVKRRDQISVDDEEELEDVELETLDEDERAARAAKIQRIADHREERRLRHEERDRVKAEAAQIKFERREVRQLKREAKLTDKKERQATRDAAEEEEVVDDPEELADIEAERLEMEEDVFRKARWPAYVGYVDSLVSRQVMKAIQTSLNLFEKQTDLEKGPQVPFMKVVAELRDPDIFFSPSLDLDEEDGLYDTLNDIENEDSMIDMYHEILQRTENSINDVVQYASKYEKYTPLWTEDRQEALANFMKYGSVISPEDFDKYRFENGTDPPEVKPKLEQYQKEVDKYNTILTELEKFIAYATKELNVELTEDDYERLLQVMRVLNEVKAKQEAGTDTMFEPLRDIMDLEILPEKWRNLVKLATVMKNTIAPIQAAQAALIAKRVSLINLRVNMYRDQYKLKEMFLVSCKEPYREMDKVHLELKQLWDYYNLVMGTIESWKKSPWKKIDADGMDQEEPFDAIEGTIKNLMTSLRAVTELQNPSIKDRHWVKFDINDDTTLADLLALSLHKYEEELEITWAAMEFDYSLHDRTGIKLPKVNEEVVEVLEDNQSFISKAGLLHGRIRGSVLFADILSNGNNPPAVGRHLTKLYDNLAVLVFPTKGSKQAFEMISKENEEHVEVWLNRVTDCMRLTLRDIFEHSVKSYEDKAREEWVFDWPAQPALRCILKVLHFKMFRYPTTDLYKEVLVLTVRQLFIKIIVLRQQSRPIRSDMLSKRRSREIFMFLHVRQGLAQSGSWGCFDEFNRISVEVLSVVSVQVKSVLDAIKAKKKKFDFMGEFIVLVPTVGMFITMNPGYAGRTELPENLKALFRPCAMVVPDFELICEIMLVAEGFQEARLLARKFITLYMLCRELLSKQDHYDWGLRAIKSVLVVAGSLKVTHFKTNL
ncbi:Dynein heavy chain 9, axonemal, partial [Operophtera brumata]